MHTKQSVIKDAYDKLVAQRDFFFEEKEKHKRAYDEYSEKYNLTITELDLFMRDIRP